MSINCLQVTAIFGLLFFGGISTIAQNSYLMCSTTNFPGYIGSIVDFNYPWFVNFLMFAGMSCAGFVWMWQVHRDGPKPKKEQPTVSKQLLSTAWFVQLISAIFDTVASGLMAIGLDFRVPTSIYQILNGAGVVFCPILSYFFLKRKITCDQTISIIIIVIGLVVVGMSCFFIQAYFSSENQDNNQLPTSVLLVMLGLVLIIISQVIYGGWYVIVEYTTQYLDCYPVQVTCTEGVYGMLLTMGFQMPIMALCGLENDWNAFVYWEASPIVLLPCLAFFICVGTYNAFGASVTKLLSANHRTIVEGLRALVVWVFALIQRLIMGGAWGEGWYGWASWVELVGFIIQLIGSFQFYGLMPLKIWSKKEWQKCLQKDMLANENKKEVNEKEALISENNEAGGYAGKAEGEANK